MLPPKLAGVRAVMFDLDGTLVDTMPAFADLAAEMMARHHGAEPGEARRRYLETSGIPFVQQLELIQPSHAANAAASDEFEARKRALCDAAPMDAETRAGLVGLRDAGLRLAVSSNTGQRFVDEFVAREGFAFDLALGFEPAAGLAKGEPHVARACAALGVTRAEVLFVGDSLADARLAAASGVAFIGRLGTFTAADFRRLDPAIATIATVGELPALLRLGRAA